MAFGSSAARLALEPDAFEHAPQRIGQLLIEVDVGGVSLAGQCELDLKPFQFGGHGACPTNQATTPQSICCLRHPFLGERSPQVLRFWETSLGWSAYRAAKRVDTEFLQTLNRNRICSDPGKRRNTSQERK